MGAWALEEGLRAATLHLAAAQSAGPAVQEATRLLLACDVGPVVSVAVVDTDTVLGIERHLRQIRDRLKAARDLVVARRLEDHLRRPR
ncbi:MAG: hypothetical protein KF729_32205 [Sandaracinaceae bacterium]|nr:hypothetical protein [Sandaracinaceae bacterium]